MLYNLKSINCPLHPFNTFQYIAQFIDSIYSQYFPFILFFLLFCTLSNRFSNEPSENHNMDQSIEIAIRIKPSNINSFSPLCGWDTHSIQVTQRNLFTFDSVIGPDASQESVFDKVGMRVVANILEGYNGCIFAYGQTGSGKTFTMTGSPTDQGLIQKCLKKLWTCVKNSEFFEIKLGYFEIYNETIRDLLSNQENLAIREHAKNGFYIENLTEVTVETYEQFEKVLKYGLAARTVKETKMNNTSSRSHSVLEVNLSYKKRQAGLMVLKHAKLTFIDLAGSQKQKQTQVEGQRLKQAANINKSLSTLSLVISKLSQQSQKKSGSAAQNSVHIPFRNSVLTRILKNSLTGKSRIIIICTVALQDKFIDETISTLRFAQMAKSIKMKVNKNEQHFDGTKERLFEEFASLKHKYFELDEINKETKNENEELKRENACLKDELEKKEVQMTELLVSMQCMKLESRQVLQEMRSQSQAAYNPGTSQSYHPQPTQNFNNYRKTQAQQKSQLNNPYHFNQYSQASIFTSQVSQSQSKRNSFFTIAEQDSKAQNSGSESKEKIMNEIEERIATLQIQIERLKVENEFMRFYRDIQELEIKDLIKKNVFLCAKESEIQQANNSFMQLVQNKAFSPAQMKFLEACLKNSQKDQLALQLSEEQKTKQKQKFNETVGKIKNLLMSYTQNQLNFTDYSINQDFIGQKTQERFMTPQKRQHMHEDNVFASNSQNNFNDNNNEIQIDNTNAWEQIPQKSEYHKSDHKKRLTQENISSQKQSQTPMNGKQKVSQSMMFYGNNTQHLNNALYRSASQFPMLMQDTRSLLSQTSNRLSNNELQYLKKDYQKMCTQVKELKEEIANSKILLLEKDSLFEEKVMELEEVIGRLTMVERDLQTQKELLEIEKLKNQEKTENPHWDGQLMEKEEEIRHLKQYMIELQKRHDSECNSLKLRNKQQQLVIGNLNRERDNMQNENRTRTESYQARLIEMESCLSQVIKEKQQLEIQYGVVNSENILLTERYNYLKQCLKTNNNNNPKQPLSPQKIYSKNSSFFSLSQPSQSIPHTQNNHPIPKPKQLSQHQCIQAVQTKSLEYMYQAAYFFYKKCNNLQDLKRTQEEKLIQLQEEINSLEQKHRHEIHQIDHDLIDAKRSALVHQEAVVDLKKEILELKQQVYEKDKLINELRSSNKRTSQYSQLLQTKLKEKNQKQLQAKQKAHNLSAQLRDNSLTPIYNDKNSRFNWGRNSCIDQSQDSLMSNGDTPHHLTDFIGSQGRGLQLSERSVEKVRGQQFGQIDEVQVLRKEIEELSNEQTSVNDFGPIVELQQQRRVRQHSGTESMVSHTVTNENLTQQQKIEQNLTPLNFPRSSLNFQGMFGKNLNKDRSKAASTKGHLQFDILNDSVKRDNVFNSKK